MSSPGDSGWKGVGPDPGYGDPLAPIGSPEWAKRWRLCFCSVAQNLPKSPATCLEFFQIGQQHRAWTLVADRQGHAYPDFDSFCADSQPYGLGMDPAKFRAYLAAELGDRAADLITVSPDGRASREREEDGTFKPADQTGNDCPNGVSDRKAKNLRAVLRAPEVVQELYREGRITQADAARLGPRSPTPEQAGRIAEARQGLERLDRSLDERTFRREARRVIAEALGARGPTGLDLLRRAWAKASKEDRDAFMEEVGREGW